MQLMQMGDIGREDAFRYELQYARFLDEEVTVRDGDVLTTTCMYDSMDRTEATPGGFGSQEEMCINFLLAYPADCCAHPHTLPTRPTNMESICLMHDISLRYAYFAVVCLLCSCGGCPCFNDRIPRECSKPLSEHHSRPVPRMTSSEHNWPEMALSLCSARRAVPHDQPSS